MAEMTTLQLVMKKRQQLKEEAVNDLFFDKGKMENAFDNTLTTVKWINRKQEWIQLYNHEEKKRAQQFRKTYEYYATESNLKINTKDIMESFIVSDPNYVEIYNTVVEIKAIIKYIEDVIQELRNKNFEIQRFIEWQKFINGK